MSCISCSCSRSKDLPQNGGESLNESGQHLRAGLAERWHSHSPVECGRQKRKHLVFCGILYFVFQTSKLASLRITQTFSISQADSLTCCTRRWIDFDNDYKTMDRSFMERCPTYPTCQCPNIRQLSLHFFLSEFQSSRHWSLYFFRQLSVLLSSFLTRCRQLLVGLQAALWEGARLQDFFTHIIYTYIYIHITYCVAVRCWYMSFWVTSTCN